MKKLIYCFSLLVLLAGCNRPGSVGDDRARVALVLKTLNNPFFIDMQTGAQEAAERLGVNLTVQAAERELDVEKQMQIIENLIQTEVDALIIAPSGSKEILTSIHKANQAAIPVLIVDTRVDEEAASGMGVEITCFIGSDNYQGGRLAAQFIADRAEGETKVVILEGIPGHETGEKRLRGFHDVLRDRPEIKVVASQTANWERDQGFNVTQNLLQAHPAIDFLFACNDMMALGAIEAISAAGRADQITVIGFDAVRDARDAILEGTLEASVAQFPDRIGRIAVENAARLISGESIPASIPVQIELITREKLTQPENRGN